ncbi:MAG: penicillin-binding protein 2 [Lachnospiraceae bacterium]|nr:penicillin-binding protein 2 [Lachnospiraceae bacterium]
MQKKLLVEFLFITVVLVGLIGRLMYIEYTSGEKYEKIVLSQQEYNSRTIPYQRGDIVDTKGTVLATSVDVYNVILDCKVLNQKEKDKNDTIDALVSCFPDLNKDDILKELEEHPASQYTVLAKRLSYDEIQPFVQMQADTEKYPNINGNAVWFEKEYIRNYPYKTLASSLIGFVSSGNVGTTGLENYYNSTLNGVNGRQYGYLNSDNNFEKTIKDPRDGNTVVTTVDVNIQSVAEEKIAEFNEKHKDGYVEGPGTLHTAVLIMNPQNGEVLAMADYPSFDLNNPRDLTPFYTEEELAGKSEEDKMDLLNQLWGNFCVNSTFEPGSTIKPFTVATGLETGKLTGNEVYICDGEQVFPGDIHIHCVSRAGHGQETVEKSLMDSCNDALMQMAETIGIEDFTTYQSIFGFGEKTNIDLPGEARTDSLMFTNETMKPIDLATNSFGQSFNCSMIQLAASFASLVNGGNLYQPHVVKKILDSEGNTIENIRPTVLKQTVSKNTSETLKTYLKAVVAEGTGNTAKVNGYSMGGKTGTAQKRPVENKKYLLSFVGYAPADNPQVLVYVVVDEPNVEDQAHSNYAQELAKNIMEEVLPYMNLYPDEAVIREPENQGEGQEGEEGETGEGQEGEEGEKPEDSLVWGDIFEDGYEDDFDDKLEQEQEREQEPEPEQGQE